MNAAKLRGLIDARFSLVAGCTALAMAFVPAADPTGPAPWDADRARAMFATPADTTVLAPVWTLAVKDSGRQVEVIKNRFSEPGFGLKFPINRVELRRFTPRTGSVYRDHVETILDAGIAAVRVHGNGQLDSTAVLWIPRPASPQSEPRNLGAHPPIPLDGSQYCVSRDGKFLLVLRLMPHAVNVRGETGHFGLLEYFDVSNPKRPRRLGPTLEADGPLQNGTVSDDGSRVAVQIAITDSTPGWSRWKVVVFERAGRRLSAPRVVVSSTGAEGVQFEGRFLFVGMQRPPLPIFVETSTTDTISLYDLGR